MSGNFIIAQNNVYQSRTLGSKELYYCLDFVQIVTCNFFSWLLNYRVFFFFLISNSFFNIILAWNDCFVWRIHIFISLKSRPFGFLLVLWHTWAQKQRENFVLLTMYLSNASIQQSSQHYRTMLALVELFIKGQIFHNAVVCWRARNPKRNKIIYDNFKTFIIFCCSSRIGIIFMNTHVWINFFSIEVIFFIVFN